MTDHHLAQAVRERPGAAGLPADAIRPQIPVSAALGEGLTPVRMEPPGQHTGLEPYRFTSGLQGLSHDALRRPIGFADVLRYDDGTEEYRLAMARKRATETGLLG